jgi:capsid protein
MRVNALDRLIGHFDPSRALKRVAARTLLQRAYEAASPRDPWRPRRGGASAQADHMADASKLRTKARFLVQNVPYIAASMDALVDNVVGTGIVPRFSGASEKKLNELWARWVSECDADGRLDFYGIEAAAYRAMEQDGEVLVRLRPRRLSDGLAVPLQLQLLEIDWLDSTRNSMLGGSADVAAGNVVIEGIEYDALGRVAAYWLWDQHPWRRHGVAQHAQFQQARAGRKHHSPFRSEAAGARPRHHAPGASDRARPRPAAVRRLGDLAQESGNAFGCRCQRRGGRVDEPDQRQPCGSGRRSQDG